MATATNVHAHDDVHISMTEVNVLFDDRSDAERAAEALKDRRMHAEDVRVWDAAGHPLWAFDARLHDDMRWAGRDGLIAALLGAAVMGALTVALAADTMGVGQALLLGALIGMGFGGLLGAMFGLQMAEPMDDDPLVTIDPARGAHVVTFVTSRPSRAREAMLVAGGRLVSEPGHNLPVTH